MICMNNNRITNPNNKEVRDCKSRTTEMIWMNKYRITNPNNNIVRDCKSRTTGDNKINQKSIEKENKMKNNYYFKEEN